MHHKANLRRIVLSNLLSSNFYTNLLTIFYSRRFAEIFQLRPCLKFLGSVVQNCPSLNCWNQCFQDLNCPRLNYSKGLFCSEFDQLGLICWDLNCPNLNSSFLCELPTLGGTFHIELELWTCKKIKVNIALVKLNCNFGKV